MRRLSPSIDTYGQLEASYCTCNLVMSICIYADVNRYKPIAIVFPAEPALTKFAISKGLATAEDSIETMVENPKLVSAVHAELLTVGKRGGLHGMELIQGLILVSEEWTPENVCPLNSSN